MSTFTARLPGGCCVGQSSSLSHPCPSTNEEVWSHPTSQYSRAWLHSSQAEEGDSSLRSSFRLAKPKTHAPVHGGTHDGSICFRKESQRRTVGRVATVAGWRIPWITCCPNVSQGTVPERPDCPVTGAAGCLHSMAEEGSHSLVPATASENVSDGICLVEMLLLAPCFALLCCLEGWRRRACTQSEYMHQPITRQLPQPTPMAQRLSVYCANLYCIVVYYILAYHITLHYTQ